MGVIIHPLDDGVRILYARWAMSIRDGCCIAAPPIPRSAKATRFVPIEAYAAKTHGCEYERPTALARAMLGLFKID
jgi:hypothetical protein